MTATTVRVSQDDGVQADSGSSSPSISRDGDWVSFTSDATNLGTTPSSGGRTDVYLAGLPRSGTNRR